MLCTYNGNKYILEQLDSLKKQTRKIDELIVCDDSSRDNTVSIINKWAQKNNVNVKVNVNKVSKGPAKNFEYGLSLTTGDYIMFCDQDDVWKPTKIERTLTKMKRIEAIYGGNTPCLVHTDLEVVDNNMKLIAKSFMRNQGLYHPNDDKEQMLVLLAANFVTGCTVMINSKMRDIALPFPDEILMHDYWLALLAASNGVLAFVDDSTIKYRQHGGNVVGAKKYFSVKSIKKIFKFNCLMNSIHKTITQDRVFLNYKMNRLKKPSEAKKFIDSVDRRKIFNIIFTSVHKEGLLRNFLYHILLTIYVLKGRNAH